MHTPSPHSTDTQNTLPELSARTLVIALGIWCAAVSLNYLLVTRLGIRMDTPISFPVSVYLPMFRFSGAGYGVLFLLVLMMAVRRERGGAALAWLSGTVLLVLGNLIQGVQAGFIEPFTAGKFQYYHDALRISDGGAWLARFNQIQAQLGVHAKTHPPFATLLHYGWLKWVGLPVLAGLFVFITSLAIPLLYRIAVDLEMDRATAWRLALLFSVLPAFNIYGAVSLDGVVATAMTLALWGMVRTLRYGPTKGNIALVMVGLVGASLLTFGAVFLIGALALIAGWELLKHNRWGAGIALASGLGGLVVVLLLLQAGTGYNHVEAFLTASRLENPDGFRLLSHPVEYGMTRLEDILEILLFLSLPVAIVVVQIKRLGLARYDPARWVAISGVLVLLGMFASGAFRTGETARACGFILPYLMLALSRLPAPMVRNLTLMAGAQTVAMQIMGSYYW